jgi:hypothetical protein
MISRESHSTGGTGAGPSSQEPRAEAVVYLKEITILMLIDLAHNAAKPESMMQTAKTSKTSKAP